MFLSQRKLVVHMIQDAKSEFYKSALLSDRKDMFKIVNSLLGRKHYQLPNCNSEKKLANNFSDYFNSKITNLCACLNAVCLPSSVPLLPSLDRSHIPCLDRFILVESSDLEKVVMGLKLKSNIFDPCPLWLMEQHLSTVLPNLLSVVNSSLQTGTVPNVLKHGIIRPLLKTTLDTNNLINYRPITLPF